MVKNLLGHSEKVCSINWTSNETLLSGGIDNYLICNLF